MPLPRWGIERPDPRPFARRKHAFVITPTAADADRDAISSFVALLEPEQAELVTELGCAPRFTSPPDDSPAVAQCLIGPASANPGVQKLRIRPDVPNPGEPHIRIDRTRGFVVIDGPDIEAVGEAFQFLRTTIHSGERLTTGALPRHAAAIASTIAREVVVTYPAFALRSINWSATMARHLGRILRSSAFLSSLQHLFVELEDAHTWVRNSAMNGRWPYRVWDDQSSARLTSVPTWSAGWDAGARPGEILMDLDTRDW